MHHCKTKQTPTERLRMQTVSCIGENHLYHPLQIVHMQLAGNNQLHRGPKQAHG